MRYCALLTLLAACGGPAAPADLAQAGDQAAPADLGPTDDLPPPGDLAMAALLCEKYGPPMLPPFVGSQYGVDNRPNVGDAPMPTGGDIAEGQYVITSNTSYGGGNSNGTPQFRSLLILEGGAWFYRIEFSGVDDMLYSGGRLTVDPANRTLAFGNNLCGSGGQPPSDPMKYSATPTALKTYLDRMVGPAQTPTIKEVVYTKQ